MKQRILIISMLLISVAAVADTARDAIREGNRLYAKPDFVAAEVAYRRAIEAEPSSATALFNLGCALQRQGKEKDSLAVAVYVRAVSDDADIDTSPTLRAAAWHNIGVSWQQKKQYDKAIDAYKNSLRQNPEDEQTRYNLALCQKLKQQQDQQNKDENKDKQDRQDQNQQQDQQDQQNKDQQDKDQQNKDKNRKEDEEKQQNAQQNPQNNNQQNRQNQQQNQQSRGMSRENAERLLQMADQQEQATRQRMKQVQAQGSGRSIDKNW